MNTEMCKLYQDVLEDGVSLVDRMPSIELTLARRMSYKLSVPSEAVEDVDGYFQTTHHQTLCRVIGEFGDDLPLNQIDVMKLTKALWRIRYDLVHFPWNRLVDTVVSLMSKENQENVGGENPKPFARELAAIPPRYTNIVSNDIYWHMDNRIDAIITKLFD